MNEVKALLRLVLNISRKPRCLCQITILIFILTSVVIYLTQPVKPIVISKYNVNVRKIRDSLDTSCKCHDNIDICLGLDEFDTYTIHVTNSNNQTNEYSYKMGMFEFNFSNMACNPFNVLRRGQKQKVISFSIGEFKKETINQIKTLVKSAKKFYPDWVIRMYHNGNIPLSAICELECLQNELSKEYYDNIDFCNINDLTFEELNISHVPAPFWKWLPSGDLFVDVFLSRDVNYCIGEREAIVVNEWLKTDFPFHIIRGKYL